MDVHVVRRGQPFVWESEKAASNYTRHEVTFDDACGVFFDFGLTLSDAGVDEERRDGALGLSASLRLLYVVYTQGESNVIRIISARLADGKERRAYENNA
jgi:uncharacterized DUF497 family protein